MIATAVLVATSAVNSSRATELKLEPSSAIVSAGSATTVKLSISGLGFATPPSLGTFDLDLTYDPNILIFSAFTFGDPGLGDQVDLGGFGLASVDSSIPGVLNLFELSLDAAADVDELQPDSFLLGVTTFTAVAPGFSSLDILINALGNALGDHLSATILNGSVTVIPGTLVPDLGVGAWALALSGVAALRVRAILDRKSIWR
jgi:hypothetical protein